MDISATLNFLDVEISQLEAEKETLDPQAGLEKLTQIFKRVLVQAHATYFLEELLASQQLFIRATHLETHFNEKTPIGQVASVLHK